MDFKEAGGSLSSQDSASNANSCVLECTGYSGLALQLTGTWVATVQFEGSADGVTFVALNATPTNSSTAATNATGNGAWGASCAGMKKVRARCSAFTSGSVVVTLVAVLAGGGGGSGGSGSSGGAVLDGSDGTIKATVKHYTDSNPLAVVLTNTSGDAYLAGASANPATATLTNIAGSSSSGTALASNAARLGVEMQNDGDAACYLKYGATASATSYTRKLLPGEGFTLLSPVYTGRIDVIWDAAVTAGALRVTEMTA